MQVNAATSRVDMGRTVPSKGMAHGVVRKLGKGHFKPEVEAKLSARFAHRLPEQPSQPLPDEPAPGTTAPGTEVPAPTPADPVPMEPVVLEPAPDADSDVGSKPAAGDVLVIDDAVGGASPALNTEYSVGLSDAQSKAEIYRAYMNRVDIFA